MSLINIYIDSIYACHIGYFAKLLKLNFNIVSPIINKNFNFNTSDYYPYYLRMINKLYDDTSIYLEPAFFEYYIKNSINFNSINNIIDSINITITDNISLKSAENNFLTELHNNNILSPLYRYEYSGSFEFYINSIKLVFELIIDTPILQSDFDYYYIHNGLGLYSVNNDKFINLFSWIHLLYFSVEGKKNNLDVYLSWINLFKMEKFNINLNTPIIAVILSGYSRDFITHYPSHKIYIENPYIDIFIHTWTHKGPRYEFKNQFADIITLKNLYNPTKIIIEDNQAMISGFSLLNKLNPIFLAWGQQGDDATRYVNGQLYSTWKAMTLIEQYEITNNIKYNGIIKMNFNMDITNFNFKGIIIDISKNFFGQDKNGLYVANKYYNTFNTHIYPYTGGGCSRCDIESRYINYSFIPKHPYHFNDISQSWFWANRIIGQKACELYLHATQIMIDNQQQNIANYPNVRYKQYREFIYIQEPVNYQGKVYNIDDKNKLMVCFYPERLMREYMNNNSCISSINISGTVKEFDALSHKIN